MSLQNSGISVLKSETRYMRAERDHLVVALHARVSRSPSQIFHFNRQENSITLVIEPARLPSSYEKILSNLSCNNKVAILVLNLGLSGFCHGNGPIYRCTFSSRKPANSINKHDLSAIQ